MLEWKLVPNGLVVGVRLGQSPDASRRKSPLTFWLESLATGGGHGEGRTRRWLGPSAHWTDPIPAGRRRINLGSIGFRCSWTGGRSSTGDVWPLARWSLTFGVLVLHGIDFIRLVLAWGQWLKVARTSRSVFAVWFAQVFLLFRFCLWNVFQ